MNTPRADVAIRKLASLLARETGQQLLANRHWRIEAALHPVLQRNAIADVAALAAIVDDGRQTPLLTECIEAMMNNETCFFRDQANFALLTGPVLDALRAQRCSTKKLRIWSAACSTGQEAYSLALMILENAEKWRDWSVQIVATDISAAALSKARAGAFSQFEIQRGLPVRLMLRYFDQQNSEWIAQNRLRSMVSFAQHNLLAPPQHLGQFDILLCRNVLMYLCEDRRRKVFDHLASALAPDGVLMLGAAETVIGQTDRLEASRVFRGFYQHINRTERAQLLAG